MRLKRKSIKITLIIIAILLFLSLLTVLWGKSYLNHVYQDAVDDLSKGNYEVAIEKLKWIQQFKTNELIEEKLELAIYEEVTHVVVDDFFEQLSQAYPKLAGASSVKEVVLICESLQPIFFEFEALELNGDSQLSDLVASVKRDTMYQLFKDDYIFGDQLDSISNTSGLSSVVQDLAVYTVTEIISGCVESILKYKP